MAGAPGGTNSRGGLGGVDDRGDDDAGLPAGTGVVQVTAGVGETLVVGTSSVAFGAATGKLTSSPLFTAVLAAGKVQIGGAAAAFQFDASSPPNVELAGIGGLAVAATNGFPYLPSMAGAPTGTPTGISNMRPAVVDRSNGRLYVNQGGVATWDRLDMRLLGRNLTSVGNIGAGGDTLHSYTIPGNTLLNNGESIEAEFMLTFAANANSKRVDLEWDIEDIFQDTQLQNGGTMWVKCRIFRVDGTTQRIMITVLTEATVLSFKAVYSQFFVASRTLSGSIVLGMIAEGVANNDIVCVASYVRWLPTA